MYTVNHTQKSAKHQAVAIARIAKVLGCSKVKAHYLYMKTRNTLMEGVENGDGGKPPSIHTTAYLTMKWNIEI